MLWRGGSGTRSAARLNAKRAGGRGGAGVTVKQRCSLSLLLMRRSRPELCQSGVNTGKELSPAKLEQRGLSSVKIQIRGPVINSLTTTQWPSNV